MADGTGPTQGQRKTLTRVGIEPTTFGLDLRRYYWKFSLSAILSNLSGKDWNPRQARSMKGFVKKKKILKHSNEVSSTRYLYLVSVLYHLSPLLECGFCEI